MRYLTVLQSSNSTSSIIKGMQDSKNKSNPEYTPHSSENHIIAGQSEDNSEKKSSNKKLLIGMALMLVMIVSISAVLFFYTSRRSSKSNNEQTTVPEPQSVEQQEELTLMTSLVEGEAWKVVDGRRIEIMVNDELVQGDGIMTEEEARLVLTLPDGSSIRIDQDSEIMLKEVSSEHIILVDNKGLVYITLNQDPTRQFEVLAGETSVVALGTIFSVENREEVKVNVFESSVKVKKQEKEIEVKEAFKLAEASEEPEELEGSELNSNEFLIWSMEQERDRINKEVLAMLQQEIGDEVDATNKEEYKEALQDAAQDIDKKELQKEAFRGSTSGDVNSINLTAEKIDSQTVKLSWSADGLADNGFRLTWSQNDSPTYPKRDGDKATSKDLYGYEKHISIKPGSGSWNFRVCESLVDTCGVYSNQVSISF